MNKGHLQEITLKKQTIEDVFCLHDGAQRCDWLPPFSQEGKTNRNNDLNHLWWLDALWSPHIHTRCLEVEDYDLLMLGTILKYSSAVSQFHRMSSHRTWDCMSSIEPREALLPLNCVSGYKLFLILKPECVWVSTSSSPLSRRINTGAPSVLIIWSSTPSRSLSLSLSVKTNKHRIQASTYLNDILCPLLNC